MVEGPLPTAQVSRYAMAAPLANRPGTAGRPVLPHEKGQDCPSSGGGYHLVCDFSVGFAFVGEWDRCAGLWETD